MAGAARHALHAYCAEERRQPQEAAQQPQNGLIGLILCCYYFCFVTPSIPQCIFVRWMVKEESISWQSGNKTRRRQKNNFSLPSARHIFVQKSHEPISGLLVSSIPISIVARARFALEIIFLQFGLNFEQSFQHFGRTDSSRVLCLKGRTCGNRDCLRHFPTSFFSCRDKNFFLYTERTRIDFIAYPLLSQNQMKIDLLMKQKDYKSVGVWHCLKERDDHVTAHVSEFVLTREYLKFILNTWQEKTVMFCRMNARQAIFSDSISSLFDAMQQSTTFVTVRFSPRRVMQISCVMPGYNRRRHLQMRHVVLVGATQQQRSDLWHVRFFARVDVRDESFDRLVIEINNANDNWCQNRKKKPDFSGLVLAHFVRISRVEHGTEDVWVQSENGAMNGNHFAVDEKTAVWQQLSVVVDVFKE